MSLISTTIPNLINGVSQQPYALRLASQAEEQINGYSSVVEGLRKRPGSRHIARLQGATGNAFTHTINRDPSERYIMMVQGGDLKVWDVDGNQKTVTFPNGKGYLSATDPTNAFRCITVADYTFVLNTTKTVAKGTTTSPTRPFEALAWVKQGSYGAKYTLRVADKTATYTVPDGSATSHATNVTTDYIAGQLRNSIATSLGTGWTVTLYGSTIYIKRTDGATFSINSDDSIGDNGMEVVAGKVQRFSELPARAVGGFKVEVIGDQSSSFDNYYVEYDVSGTSNRRGVWKESVQSGELDSLDATTMPHALVRNADGSFTFKVLTWDKRKVGDLDSNPFPSFVGRKLNDIFFHRNRLGFISDENIVMSKAGKYFDFFIGTATAILDDDPIDVGVSHSKVSILRHAIPFNKTLLLFSDQTQFQLGATEILTPETISVNQTTEYEASLRAKPVGAGRFVYFVVNRGAFSGIREYYVDGSTESEEAQEITGHVPKYVPGGIYKLAISSGEDAIVALSDQAPNKMYVYKYYWGGQEKLQASWSQWCFAEGDRILNADFIESRLYVLVERFDGVHLEMIDLEPGATEDNWDISVHLDSVVKESQVTLTFVENDPTLEGDNQTRIELPYKMTTGTPLQLIAAPGGSKTPGRIEANFTWDNSGTNSVLIVSGDWRNQPFYIGLPYEFRYKFSPFNIKEEAVGGGQMTIGEGRIQLRRVSLLYDRAGYFRVEVTPSRRETYRYIFSGRVVGSGKNLIGQVSIESGKFPFPVAAKHDQVTIELVNDSFLPSYFLSAEWEAFYSIRSRRL